jgi:hypothetical protein
MLGHLKHFGCDFKIFQTLLNWAILRNNVEGQVKVATTPLLPDQFMDKILNNVGEEKKWHK